MDTSKITPITDLTALEVLNSLTGFEEIAIAKRFDGATINDLLSGVGTTAKRALIFTLYCRQDNGPKDPWKAAMNIKVADLDAYFAADEDDPDEDGLPGASDEGPVSEQGKDEPELVTPPTNLPTSAS